MTRGPLLWIAVIVAGIVAVIGVVALIGDRDDSDETVSAGEWAQNVCGTIAVWHGEIEATVEDIRTPPAAGGGGNEEPQSETPQGRTGLIRAGLERSVQATHTMVTGVDNAGIPDTENGDEAARAVTGWADQTRNDLENALETLEEEADTLADSIAQLANATRAIGAALTSGIKTLADVARLDTELGAALRDASTCQELREEAA